MGELLERGEESGRPAAPQPLPSRPVSGSHQSRQQTGSDAESGSTLGIPEVADHQCRGARRGGAPEVADEVPQRPAPVRARDPRFANQELDRREVPGGGFVVTGDQRLHGGARIGVGIGQLAVDRGGLRGIGGPIHHEPVDRGGNGDRVGRIGRQPAHRAESGSSVCPVQPAKAPPCRQQGDVLKVGQPDAARVEDPSIQCPDGRIRNRVPDGGHGSLQRLDQLGAIVAAEQGGQAGGIGGDRPREPRRAHRRSKRRRRDRRGQTGCAGSGEPGTGNGIGRVGSEDDLAEGEPRQRRVVLGAVGETIGAPLSRAIGPTLDRTADVVTFQRTAPESSRRPGHPEADPATCEVEVEEGERLGVTRFQNQRSAEALLPSRSTRGHRGDGEVPRRLPLPPIGPPARRGRPATPAAAEASRARPAAAPGAGLSSLHQPTSES